MIKPESISKFKIQLGPGWRTVKSNWVGCETAPYMKAVKKKVWKRGHLFCSLVLYGVARDSTRRPSRQKIDTKVYSRLFQCCVSVLDTYPALRERWTESFMLS